MSQEIDNKKRPIFITGATGFVGSHLTRRLVAEGFNVAALIREKSDLGRISDILSKIRIEYGCLENADILEKKIKDLNPMGIFHLAASNIKSGVTAPANEVIRANLLGTVNLVNATSSIDYTFFIQMGSFLEYGIKSHPLRETDCPNPLELYSITKLAATLYAVKFGKANKKPIIVFRIFTPYGPDIQEGRLVYEVVSHALMNKDIKMTSPLISRDFIYVEDLISLLLEGMKMARFHSGEIFNAGSGAATTLERIVECVLTTVNSRSNVNWGSFTPVAYDSDKWQADMVKTFNTFSWRPKISIEAGIAKTVDWFIKRIHDEERQKS